jgi:hypothetical protein
VYPTLFCKSCELYDTTVDSSKLVVYFSIKLLEVGSTWLHEWLVHLYIDVFVGS